MAETFCYETFGRFEKGSAEFVDNLDGTFRFNYKWTVWYAYEVLNEQRFICVGPDGRRYEVRIRLRYGRDGYSSDNVYIGNVMAFIDGGAVYSGYFDISQNRWVEILKTNDISYIRRRQIPDWSIPEGKAFIKVEIHFRYASSTTPPSIPECKPSNFRGTGAITYYPDKKPKSSALEWYYNTTGNYCTLRVDYKNPLEIAKLVAYSDKEYNTRPDGRRADDYAAQIDDFMNGYMLGRFRFNRCGIADRNGKFIAWIKYKAELNCEQPPAPPGEEEKYIKYAAAAFAAAAALSILFRRR